MIRARSIASLAAFCVLLTSGSGLAGTIKKWVDENGVTHYGTSVPPQYKDKAHSELNRRGIEVKRHERAPTPEEIEQQEALAALRAEQQKLLEEQQARDRILLNLYRNEDDLIMARDGKIAQIDSQNKITHKEIRRLKARLSEFQAIAAQAERTGKNLNAKQRANLESTRRSIQRSYAIILAREDEKQATIESYNYDLERFRKLRQGSRRATNTEVARSEIPDLVETAVRCSAAECDALWAKAQAYARQHATTPIDLAADRILVTAPPREKDDLSITVSRIADERQGGERIFMDLQCERFSEGQEFCKGAEVTAIRENFRAALSR
jgi:hypothetical protein